MSNYPNVATNVASKALQAQIVAQWITSLAISVICCAILFIVFAGYIVDLHETTNLLTVKLELLQERHSMLQNEVIVLKRQHVFQITGTPQVVVPPAPAGMPGTPPAPEAPVAPEMPKEGGIMMPDVNGGPDIGIPAPDAVKPPEPPHPAGDKKRP